jgi:cyclopropane fatty-acyl-phospholipid synthase-like methyltransferase
MLTGTDHVIDLGAGPGHFFTLHLSNCCGSVLGLDNQAPTQEQLNLFQFFPRLQWAFGFMEEPFGVNCFDAVSCISVLEHLTPEKILSSLYHMKSALTSAGRIVLTMDVPRVKVPWFWEQVEKVGLAPAGEHSLETSDDDVVIPVGRVYRAVLEKP